MAAINMKTMVLLAVLLGVVCISYSTASPYSSNQEKRLISSLVQQLSSQDLVVEEQEDNDDTALAQFYLNLLENEVQKQDMSDEDRAEMENFFSRIKQKFRNLRSRIVKGFGKVKNFFHGGRKGWTKGLKDNSILLITNDVTIDISFSLFLPCSDYSYLYISPLLVITS